MSYIMIEFPTRKRYCHECHKEIKKWHLRGHAGHSYVNICQDCLERWIKKIKKENKLLLK